MEALNKTKASEDLSPVIAYQQSDQKQMRKNLSGTKSQLLQKREVNRISVLNSSGTQPTVYAKSNSCYKQKANSIHLQLPSSYSELSMIQAVRRQPMHGEPAWRRMGSGKLRRQLEQAESSHSNELINLNLSGRQP